MGKIELNELQNYLYQIFIEFDRICIKHNIKYSMEGGTLLGAVKYQNFVPWDDDIDVIMKREEYDKFLEIAPKELNEDYFLQSYNNVPQFPLNYAKLCFKKSLIFDYDYSHLNKMCHGIFIDIFPIDHVIPEKLKKHTQIVGVLTSARKTKLKINFGKVKFMKKIIYKLVSLLPMKTLIKLLNKACTKYNKLQTGYYYEICNSNRKFKPLPTEIYDELTELQFREKKFLAVARYDDFLKSRFSNDYMEVLPYENDRHPSHCQNIKIFKD